MRDRARLAALSLPLTLPGYPLSPFNQGTAYAPGERDWGWDTKAGAHGSPGGPELRLLAADHAGAFAADVASATPAGTRQVRGATAAVFDSKTEVLLTVTIDGVNFEASGDAGATVDDLIMAVNAVQGLSGH